MKKYLFLASVAALSFTACTNETEEYVGAGSADQQREISFIPFAQKATRAASATTPAVVDGTYPDELTMQVAAYAMHGPTSSWDAGGYFDKTPFNGTNANNWKGTPARYWPLSDAYVSFLAVAGVEEGDVTSMGDPYASGATVVYDAASFTAQTDLMYSGKQAEVTKSGNTLVFPTAVDMTFKHALAWLQFNVRAADAAYDEKFAITKIEIVGANKTGTFTITNTGYNTVGDPTPTGEWGSFTDAANYDVPSSTIPAGSLTTAYQACGKALLVPKASPATSFTKFVIYYTLDGKAFTFDYTPESTILAQATKYVYNITFKLTEIEIDPVVTPWTDGGTTFIDIPSYAAGENRTLNVRAEESTYTFIVTGFAANETVTIGKTDTHSVTKTLTTGEATADGNGVLKITFTVNASSGANSATISIDSATDSHDTEITVSQPAAS